MFIYRRFSLIPAVMFYQVAMNAELLKTEPLPLEKGESEVPASFWSEHFHQPINT